MHAALVGLAPSLAVRELRHDTTVVPASGDAQRWRQQGPLLANLADTAAAITTTRISVATA